MSSRLQSRPTKLAWASALALAAVLAACGGGGGGDDDDGGPPGTIDLSVANRDTVASVAHASVAGAMMGLGGADRVVSMGGSVATQRHLALTLRTAREQALRVSGPTDVPCQVSGYTRDTFDDRDNDGALSPGDTFTMQFVDCKDSFDETQNGTISITFTQFGDTAIAGSFRQDAFSVVREDAGQQHVLTQTGTMQLKLSASSESVGTMRLVADGPVRLDVSTPLFTDVVTLADGYVQESVIDTEALPPGGFTPGRFSTTSAGRMNSQAAGGDVTVATTAPIVQYTDDEFPRSGSLDVTGRTGSLRITALSTVDVQLDLDSNGDGTVDHTTTQRWDWLI
jgi:hypothetical protein